MVLRSGSLDGLTIYMQHLANPDRETPADPKSWRVGGSVGAFCYNLRWARVPRKPGHGVRGRHAGSPCDSSLVLGSVSRITGLSRNQSRATAGFFNTARPCLNAISGNSRAQRGTGALSLTGGADGHSCRKAAPPRCDGGHLPYFSSRKEVMPRDPSAVRPIRSLVIRRSHARARPPSGPGRCHGSIRAAVLSESGVMLADRRNRLDHVNAEAERESECCLRVRDGRTAESGKRRHSLERRSCDARPGGQEPFASVLGKLLSSVRIRPAPLLTGRGVTPRVTAGDPSPPCRASGITRVTAGRDRHYWGVEQLVARKAHNLEVVGSSPASPTPLADGGFAPRMQQSPEANARAPLSKSGGHGYQAPAGGCCFSHVSPRTPHAISFPLVKEPGNDSLHIPRAGVGPDRRRVVFRRYRQRVGRRGNRDCASPTAARVNMEGSRQEVGHRMPGALAGCGRVWGFLVTEVV